MRTPRFDSESRDVVQWLVNGVLTDAFREALHEEVQAAVEEAHAEQGTQTSTTNDEGWGIARLALVGAAAVLGVYLFRSRDKSVDELVEDASRQVRDVTDETGDRTERMSQEAGDRVRSAGSEAARRTETAAGTTAEHIEETGEEVSDRVEEGGEEAADRMDEESDDDSYDY